MFNWFKKKKIIDTSSLEMDQLPQYLPPYEELGDNIPYSLPIKDYNPIEINVSKNLDKEYESGNISVKEILPPMLDEYKHPGLNLLNEPTTDNELAEDEIEKNKNLIIETLQSYKIEIKKITAVINPILTLYEIVLAEGVVIGKIKKSKEELGVKLSTQNIRITILKERGTIGIEVPRSLNRIVSIQELLGSRNFINYDSQLPMALGVNSLNEPCIFDLVSFHNLFIVGSSGQGKSACLHSIIVSLLYKKNPSQLKFVMVDKKWVELSLYRKMEEQFLAKLPHLAGPILNAIDSVIFTLKSLCDEMDNRYELLKETGARNIKEYNDKIINGKIKNPGEHKYLPYIVLLIDEYSDLLFGTGSQIEIPLEKLAELGYTVGIHLIIATTPRTVGGKIANALKFNFPVRIALRVSTRSDSIATITTDDAEHLTTPGDMLLFQNNELQRIQGPFVTTNEINNVVDFISQQKVTRGTHLLPEPERDEEDTKFIDLRNRDKLFDDCARLVVQMQSGSTSNLQRRLNLGYDRAGRIMDQLAAANIVGPAYGSKPREVYFKSVSELDEFLDSLN